MFTTTKIRLVAAGFAAMAIVASTATLAAAAPGSSLEPLTARAAAANGLRTDVNGDGRDDVVNFTRGSAGDVYVAISNGSQFLGTGLRWHSDFSFRDELPYVGDFNGDGRHDIATFVRGGWGDVYVALSTGGGFAGTGLLWNGDAAYHFELPLVGDFNGDGRDDIAALARGGGPLYVALSTGSSFAPRTTWVSRSAFGFYDLFDVGDFNGDGRDDIASFLHTTTGQAFVALSTGGTFAPLTLWHNGVVFGGELPEVGDVNGDGRDDIIVFTRGSTGDVYVALSLGTPFASLQLWHRDFSFRDEIPGVGDFNGDGRDDIITFHRGRSGTVFVALSSGAQFLGTGVLWHPGFSFGNDLPEPTCIVGAIVA